MILIAEKIFFYFVVANIYSHPLFMYLAVKNPHTFKPSNTSTLIPFRLQTQESAGSSLPHTATVQLKQCRNPGRKCRNRPLHYWVASWRRSLRPQPSRNPPGADLYRTENTFICDWFKNFIFLITRICARS